MLHVDIHGKADRNTDLDNANSIINVNVCILDTLRTVAICKFLKIYFKNELEKYIFSKYGTYKNNKLKNNESLLFAININPYLQFCMDIVGIIKSIMFIIIIVQLKY